MIKVLVLGFDGATWNILAPLIKKDFTKNLQKVR